MSMGEWQAHTLEVLLQERAAGQTSFATAWRHSQVRCRALGLHRPKDYYGRAPKDDPDWMPFSSFWRRALEREWYGLARADFAGLREMLEESNVAQARVAPARRVSARRGTSRVVPLG